MWQSIEQFLPSTPGNVVDIDTGKVVEKHGGLWWYTIGQGARIGGLKDKYDPLSFNRSIDRSIR